MPRDTGVLGYVTASSLICLSDHDEADGQNGKRAGPALACLQLTLTDKTGWAWHAPLARRAWHHKL
ncbi:MAG: hypothetical protein HRU31_14275 [Rhodobacteraceae bacterium]|nr:hypothetical protein [Paracoccaceae bacterium]